MRRTLGRLAGWALALGGLAWVFHDVDLAVVANGFGRLSPPLAVSAIVIDATAFLCQGWRWRLLLRPWGELSVLETTTAVYAGLFTNEVVPFRAGEIVRAFLVSRRLSVDLVTVLASVVVERFFDALWLALAVGSVAIFVPLPAELTRAADILGGAVVLGGIVFAWLAFRRRDLGRAATAVRTLGSTPAVLAAFGVSSGVLGFQLVAFWLMLEAYGIRLPLLAGAAVMLVVVLGTALPNAPGNVGTYQLFCVLGLGLFGVEKPVAAGFSVVAFVVLTVPLWLLGALALAASGEGLAALRASRARRKSEG